MNLVKIFALVLCFGFSASLSAQKILPSVEIKTLEGQSVNIQEYAENGKITIISFWATWCKPCKKELDTIHEVYEDWVADYEVELVAITIDTRRDLGKVKPLIEEKGWEYTILSDSKGDLKNALNFQTVPQTFLLDQEGNIVYTHSGYKTGDEVELEDKIKELAEK